MKKAISLVIALAMVLALVPATVMAADEGTDSSLIAYLSFDNGIEAEVGGVKINGTVSTAAGLVGTAASIPSGVGNYLNITDADGNNNLLVGKNAVTIAFFENRTSQKWPLYIAPSTAAPAYNSNENYIGLYDDDAFRLERYVGARNKETSSTISGSVLSGWKHIAIVVTDDYSELYVNGRSIGKADSKSTLAELFTSASYFQVGRANWGSGEDFVGLIDELYVYDRVLAPEEIADLAADKIPTTIEDVIAQINLTEGVITENLSLLKYYGGADITWSSSDTKALSDDGKVTRTGNDVEVTLTASIALAGKVPVDHEFKFTVKALELTEDDFKAALEIHNTDNILDSVTLLSEVHGIPVKWTSSNPDVVSDKPVPHDGYEYTPGYVTRGDKDEKVTLTAEFEYAGKPYKYTYDLTVKAVKPEEEKVAYLYAYFRGNVNGAPEVQQIHFATSEDGYNWTDLNGNWPVLTSSMGTKNLRDPYIIRSRYGDKFYALATDLDTQDGQGWGPWSLAGSKYLMVWESEDLVNWSDQMMVKFANDDIGCAWAPESIYDDETGEYLVYASGKDLKLKRETGKELDTVYVVRTRDFQSFSEPEIFFIPQDDNGNRVAAIDSTIIHADDGKYYQFYKKFNSQVWMMVSDHAAGPYKEVRSFSPIGGEGPAIYKVNGTEQYCLAIDNYSVYVPYLTNDIASGIFTKGTGEITMPTGSKHGVMIPITQKEYDGLLAAYGAAPDDENVLTYDFEDEAATKDLLHGGATIVKDEEKGSNVLSLDGVDGYFQFPEKIFDRRDTFTLLMDVKSNMTGNFLTFAVGSGDTEHYMFFRGRNNQLRMAGTISGWQSEHEAKNDNVGLTDEWARIALVVKPGYYAIYKDGVIVAENDNVTVTNLSKEAGGGSLLTTSHLGLENLVAYLGKSFFPADAYVKGSFDNVALYNRELNAGEILQDAMGNDVTDEDLMNSDIEAVTIPETAIADIDLPVKGSYGSTIVWETSNADVISADGKVKRPALMDGDAEVTLTATYTNGTAKKVVEYKVKVKAADNVWVAPDNWSSTHEFDPVSGKVYISFDFTPLAKADTSVGIGPASITPNGWGQYNIGFRTSSDGYFQVHNNAFVGTVPYELGKTYHVSITTDTAAQTFSCYVTDEEGNKSTVAENAVYRDKTKGALAKVNIRGGDKVPAGAFTVENFMAFSVSAESALSIKDGAEVADLGIAYTAKISGTPEYVKEVGFEYGVYTAADGKYTVSPVLAPQPFDEVNGDSFRLTINKISNANSARRYVARPYIVAYDGEKLYGDAVEATLYGALVDSILNGAGESIIPARLAAANSIIAYVAKNKKDDSYAKFPGLQAAYEKLYPNGAMAEKAAGYGISDDASVLAAEALSLEAVELEFVATEVAESETIGDITSELDFVPEL